jgi:hypothetical protein
MYLCCIIFEFLLELPYNAEVCEKVTKFCPLLPWVCGKVIEFCPLLPFCHKIYDTFHGSCDCLVTCSQEVLYRGLTFPALGNAERDF